MDSALFCAAADLEQLFHFIDLKLIDKNSSTDYLYKSVQSGKISPDLLDDPLFELLLLSLTVALT